VRLASSQPQRIMHPKHHETLTGAGTRCMSLLRDSPTLCCEEDVDVRQRTSTLEVNRIMKL
jgi:hypothetical protein